MWQAIVVGALVCVSAAYAAWALMPAATRRRLAQSVLRWSEGRPAMRWLRNAARSVESHTQKRLTGCVDCGSVASVRRDKPGQ